MRKKEYKLLLENWKLFLNEEDKKIASGQEFIDKFILNGVLKVREEILRRYATHSRPHDEKNLKLIISIKKISSFDYLLRAFFVSIEDKEIKDSNIADVAFVEFQKINKIDPLNYSLHYNNKEEFKTINNKEGFTITNTDFIKYELGPLIYDIILEFVSKNNSILCSDRTEVSKEAQKVWDSYLKRDDVKTIQLDNVDIEDEKKWSKDFIKDDITQISASNDSGKDNWMKSSLSKGFYKENYSIISYLLNNENFIVDIPGFKVFM